MLGRIFITELYLLLSNYSEIIYENTMYTVQTDYTNAYFVVVLFVLCLGVLFFFCAVGALYVFS